MVNVYISRRGSRQSAPPIGEVRQVGDILVGELLATLLGFGSS